jgi:hypothetical protein
MDLNSAIHTAECGGHIRDDVTMAAGWSIRFDKGEKLLYYFNPKGEKAHKVRFSDAHRASFQWRTTIGGE